ncbi:isoprenyl synthetase [Fulvitalea axinellae]|uniref:Isoprenyl synthetase n=1 Tax=Fulvitalea axinellae TaxID=1182444 RepID=A0AAU9CSV9_9BACT|nr:isoprenyl synthetase [Fulvitalea axinellae]
MDTKKCIEEINEAIEATRFGENPVELYEPIRYIMKLGGKRLRPLTALLAYSLFKDDYKTALRPALGVEVFHNFTLVHDDIMDNAPLRRGKATIHEKWDQNVAILSGDVMMIRVYNFFLETAPDLMPRVIRSFNDMAVEVCEGQQKDMNFESRDDVSAEEYIDMIRQKTAVLLGFCAELGATLAYADEKDIQLLQEFGVKAGLGFQIKDDLLDVYGDATKFGKKVGGDIVENKKTYLLIKALETAQGEDAEELRRWVSATEFDETEKVKAVTAIYDRLGVREATEKLMNDYFAESLEAFDRISVAKEKGATFRAFAENLINRDR